MVGQEVGSGLGGMKGCAMGADAFQFSAQPALDRAVQRLQAAEKAMGDVQRYLDQEQRALSQLKERYEDLIKQHNKSREQLSNWPKGTTLDGDHIDALRSQTQVLARMLERQRTLVLAKESVVLQARERVQLRRRVVQESLGSVKAIEAVKEARLREFRVARNQAAMRREDDEAISHFTWATRVQGRGIGGGGGGGVGGSGG